MSSNDISLPSQHTYGSSQSFGSAGTAGFMATQFSNTAHANTSFHPELQLNTSGHMVHSRTTTPNTPTAPSQSLPSVPPSSQPTTRLAPIQRGRVLGQRNISDGELDILFEVMLEHLPMGATGWASVTADYNARAQAAGYGTRENEQLRRKMRKLIKEAGGRKPMGKSKKAKRLLKAWEVDWAIRGRYGAGVLDDSAAADDSSEDDDDNGDAENHSLRSQSQSTGCSQSQGTWVVEKAYKSSLPAAQESPIRSRNNATLQAISNIASAFDPDQIRVRDEAKAKQRVLLLQLTNAQQEIQRLHAEVDRLRNALSAAELRAQRAEDRLEMEKDKFSFELKSSSSPVNRKRARTEQEI
ncbi:hypothetical protein F5880DRAFT_1614173 [Lentinula raphanica]|nr:hypothetical protein F5880DRAFT_1614173 [Lentinula raphanica]